jgi:hypothetical protein
MVTESFVLRMSICGKKPAHRKSAKRQLVKKNEIAENLYSPRRTKIYCQVSVRRGERKMIILDFHSLMLVVIMTDDTETTN